MTFKSSSCNEPQVKRRLGVLAITGAAGQVGGRVAARLAALALSQRLIVRDGARAPILPRAGIVQASSYSDAAAMRQALAGVGTLFLVSARDRFGVNHMSAKSHTPPPQYDRLEQHRVAIDSSVAAGVRHIVYLSMMTPRQTAPSFLPMIIFTPSSTSAQRGFPSLSCEPVCMPIMCRSVSRQGTLSVRLPAKGAPPGSHAMTSQMWPWPPSPEAGTKGVGMM
jgi:hypothetical protein